MKTYLFKRFFQSLLAVLGVATIVFFIIRISGDPVRLMLPPEASEEQVQNLRGSLGFNEPLIIQYFNYLKDIVTGNFGNSLYYKDSAIQLVLERMPATIELAIYAIVIAILVGIIAGIISTYKRNTWIDYTINSGIFLAQSLPVFWVGIVLILIFAVHLNWLPTSGNMGWSSIILPALALAAYPIAPIARTMRSSLIDVMEQGYIVTSRAQGYSIKSAMVKRGLKNAFLPVITVISMEFGVMIAGAVVTETIFSWPGVGQLIIQAVNNRDFPLVQACVLVISIIYITINFITDMIYLWLDPRIKVK